jgi:flagellar motor protein MotB
MTRYGPKGNRNAALANRGIGSSVARVAYLVRTTRVGRSQGASIFWGLVSCFFAAAACFYYWKNHENEASANVYRDQVLELQEDRETLNSQKEKLQASITETENQLKTREDLIQQKETELAAEESGLDELGQQSQKQSQENLAQVAVVKKFNDLIRKLGQAGPTDVVERGGRPVLRIPNAQLFAPGDATLKPEGKALLTQIGDAFNGQFNNFELRVVSYTDSDAEASASTDPAKTKAPSSWDLTASRAANIAQFYHDTGSLPFLSVLVLGRGDAEPIAANSPARNRRVEITVAPTPVTFHPPDIAPIGGNAGDSTDPATATNATPAAKKAKDKTPDKDKTSGQH